jgi:tetratricopeptide (TPR) repeat protein
LKKFARDDARKDLSRRIREETLVALHRLGETKPIDDHLAESRLAADRLLKGDTTELKESGCDQLFTLGLLHTRLRKFEDAVRVYDELLAALDRPKMEDARLRNYPTTCYNLACIKSLQGQKAAAVDWLEKAVRSGFRDRGWIKADKDLDAIRNEDAYKKLIADETLFGEKR